MFFHRIIMYPVSGYTFRILLRSVDRFVLFSACVIFDNVRGFEV